MPGPRKVRVFQDRKKSPNWYVEWRDTQGRRHAESCGPDRSDAEQRAQQVRQEIRATRLASAKKTCTELAESSSKVASSMVTNVLRLRARIDWGESEVPVEISVELTPELLQALRGAICPVSDE